MLQTAGCGVPKLIESGQVDCGVSVAYSERTAGDETR